MINAIMMPRPINVTGTATAACTPGEHNPVHDFASERTPGASLVAEAAAGEVKDVFNVEAVEEVMDVEMVGPEATRGLDVAPAVLVGDEDVCAVDVAAFVDSLADVVLTTALVLEVLPPSASGGLVSASGVVAGDAVAVTFGVGRTKFCVGGKDDMAVGDEKVAENGRLLLNGLDIVPLFRPSRPIPRSLPVPTRGSGLRLFAFSTAPEVLAEDA